MASDTLTRSDRAQERTGRKSRVPLGVSRIKLNASKREGYVRRWINDVPGRLNAAQQAGYEFVSDDPLAASTNTGTRISQVVDKSTGLTSYLMEIPEEFYEEDQAKKAEDLDKIDEELRRGDAAGGKVGRDGRYVPKQGIKISRH